VSGAGARRTRLSRAHPLLAAVLGAALLVALVARLGSAAVLDGLRAVDGPAVLVAVGVGLLAAVLNGWRWCLVARGLGLRLALPGAVADCYRASLLNAVLPAGVLGDVHRALGHGRRCGDLGRGARAVLLERTAGLVVLVAVGAGALLARPGLVAAVSGPATPRVLGGLAVVGLALLCLPRVRAALVCVLTEARRVLAGTWSAVVALSVAALAGYLVLFVVAARLVGAQLPLGELVPLLVLALAATGLPIGVGGFGPREAAAATAFGTVGLDPAQGLAVAVVYGALTLVACLPALAVPLLRRMGGATGPPGPSLARC